MPGFKIVITALRLPRSGSTLLLPLAAVVALLISGCRRPEPAAGSPVLRVSQRNEPATLDPHLATLPDEFFIIRALGEGLLAPDPAGGPPRPAAAERWEVSDDGLTWTFHLRAARWSNGDPVTARDFVRSCQRILTPAIASPSAHQFLVIAGAAAYHRGDVHDFARVGIAAPDDRTLVITLAHPVADFAARIASGPWIPIHPATLERHGAMDQRQADWTAPGRHVGNGPFVLTGWRPNRDLTVARNPAWRDAGRVQLAGITFLAFDNGDAEERAFRAGQLDVTLAVPPAKLDTYRDARPPVLRSFPIHETRYLTLNLERPALAHPGVRRALALAIDRTALTRDILRGGQQPARSFIPPGLGGYQPRSLLSEPGREAAARSALAAAGYPGGRGFPRLELSAWGVTPVILEAIQQQWRTVLGLEVAIVQREAKTHLAALAAGDYDIGFMTAIPDYDSAGNLLADLTTGAPANYPRWSNPAYDRLVAEAARTLAPDRRQELERQAEALLLAELPLIPVYFNSRNFLVRPQVRGWQEDALWTRYYQNVSLHEN